MRMLLITLSFVAIAVTTTSATAMYTPTTIIHRHRHPLAMIQLRTSSVAKGNKKDYTGSKVLEEGSGDANKPPAFLQWAYSACGLAMTSAWTTIVVTTIRSNQPLGAMMPTFQHGIFARIGALSAVPLIVSSFAILASSSAKDSWKELSSPTCRRHNLALAVAGVGGALWVGFCPILTQIPGSNPLVSHQAYSGAMRTALIACYGSAAALTGSVWGRSLPENVRDNPLSWPGRIADGVSKSLVSLSPVSTDNPVNVKYAILASSFLLFTGLQLGSHPLSVIPSWTGRRLARAFPAWTLLAAVSSYDLKEAVETGKNIALAEYRTLSCGLKGFGITYLAAKAGAIFLDSSFPESYHAVNQVPAWAAAAIVIVSLTLRPDTIKNIFE